jgi:hypothetical protein
MHAAIQKRLSVTHWLWNWRVVCPACGMLPTNTAASRYLEMSLGSSRRQISTLLYQHCRSTSPQFLSTWRIFERRHDRDRCTKLLSTTKTVYLYSKIMFIAIWISHPANYMVCSFDIQWAHSRQSTWLGMGLSSMYSTAAALYAPHRAPLWCALSCVPWLSCMVLKLLGVMLAC